MDKPPPGPSSWCDLDVQVAIQWEGIPCFEQFELWVAQTLSHLSSTPSTPQPLAPAELSIRIVDSMESAELNETYRHKPGPTNVLSFPFESPPGVECPLLGDLIICAPVVAQEAKEQDKTLHAHWAHMVVHGTLHLTGYDHITEAEANIMETLERNILAQLDYPDPYQGDMDRQP